jgi:hypothetical protein
MGTLLSVPQTVAPDDHRAQEDNPDKRRVPMSAHPRSHNRSANVELRPAPRFG